LGARQHLGPLQRAHRLAETGHQRAIGSGEVCELGAGTGSEPS
jgi:hypothetical protein